MIYDKKKINKGVGKMCFRRKQIIKFDQNVEGVSSDNRSVLLFV